MESRSDIIKQHMTTVREMGILEDEVSISQTDLKQISQDLGLTDEDWTMVLTEANKSLALAQSHFNHQSYEACIKAAEDALLLNPFILGARGWIAKAYWLRYLHDLQEDYKEKAKKQAELTLAKESRDKNAIEVVSALSEKSRVVNLDNKTAKAKPILLIVGVIIAVLLLIFVATKFVSNGKTVEEEKVLNLITDLNSAFERQETLIPSFVEILDENSSEDANLIKTLEDYEKQLLEPMDLVKEYEIQTELTKLLTKILVEKSLTNDAKILETLSVKLSGAESRMKTKKQQYNKAVSEYTLNGGTKNYNKIP